MKKTIFRAAIIAMAALTTFAADITGKWKATMQMRENKMEVTFDLKADGDKLTGAMVSQMGEAAISDGKVDGDKVEFKIKREFNGNAMVLVYKGTVSGDELKMTQSMEGGQRPPRDIVANRAK